MGANTKKAKGAPKPKKGGRPRPRNDDEVIDDPRFARVHSDPRFQTMPKSKRKVQIDERFKGMFDDPRFQSNYVIDEYGRKVETDAYGDNLHRYYELEDDQDKSSDEPDVLPSSEDDGDPTDEGARDISRVGFETDSSDDDASSESSDDGVKVDEEAGDQTEEKEDVPLGGESRRLAIVNLEWDRVRAVDLLVMLQSFVGDSGNILSVTVYTSEYGREMIRKESEWGPQNIWAGVENDETKNGFDQGLSSDDEDDDREDGIDMERLRQYERQKLRYYFAVVECDAVACASRLYAECDGLEFEQTSNLLDMRFVPDDVVFQDEHIRDRAVDAPEGYNPTDFITSSLHHSRVKCSWDADDPNRQQFFRRKLTHEQLDNRDIEVYLAPADSDAEGTDAVVSETDGEGEKVALKRRARSRYLGLLKDIKQAQEKEDEEDVVGDITVSFTPGLSNIGQAMLDAKTRKEALANETVWEARQRKRKEKKRVRGAGGVTLEESLTDPLTLEEKNDLFFADAFKDDHYIEEQPDQASRGHEAKSKSKGKRHETKDPEDDKKRAELELLLLNEGDDGEALHRTKGYNLKQLVDAHENKSSRSKKKNKRQKMLAEEEADGRKIDGEGGAAFDVQTIVDDDRFKAIFEREEFAIDPTDPAFKNTDGMSKLQQIRQQKRKERAAMREQEIRERKRQALSGDASVQQDNSGASVPGDARIDYLVKNLKKSAANKHPRMRTKNRK
ncbi:NUC153 domain-containing protein [Plasmodiophora brassicae]|uniref:Uncharacterized protein n=1 Tax=Plasmodiophora brassicae TaxID=37360 RepID=A0A0G4IJ87_PLABS|nr:hypothetical protein PBRA_004000 [Plasmodiophora brassicae]SPQ96314.1 unnamed protein product [Plasmodiophora brassicae]